MRSFVRGTYLFSLRVVDARRRGASDDDHVQMDFWAGWVARATALFTATIPSFVGVQQYVN